MFTLGWVELHLVGVAPILQLSHVPLGVLGILSMINCSIDDCVISKKPDVWADVSAYIIYKEQNRIGPSTDHWGTSEMTDFCLWYHTSRVSAMWHLVKSLIKIHYNAVNLFVVKNIEWRSWLKSMSWESHDRPSQKPCCCGMRMPRSLQAHFLSLAQSKLRLCWANHRPGYWGNLPCDWPSIAWAYSEQETENGPRCLFSWLTMMCSDIYEHTYVEDTGLQLDALFLDPFIHMGTTLASFHCFGSWSVSYDWTKDSLKGQGNHITEVSKHEWSVIVSTG